VSEPEHFDDVERIASHTRALWSDAAARVNTARIELFAKTSHRVRLTRELGETGVLFDRSIESGLAVRAIRVGHDQAGFAATSGLDADAIRWAVDTACTYRAQAPAAVPSLSEIAAERSDLDAPTPLPAEEALTQALLKRPNLEWLEAGTTIEILIGVDGWLAARRRHRFWALDGADARLIAQRGLDGWEERLDVEGESGADASPRGSRGSDELILTPRAAAPVVAALVARFHGSRAVPRGPAGTGWTVADDPAIAGALAGGSFDDAGFPSTRRELAAGGLWVGRLSGPGTFRRASFRDIPAEAATNVVMVGGAGYSLPAGGTIVRRARVIQSSGDVWVLELTLDGDSSGGVDRRRWLRIDPATLLDRCVAGLGEQRVTADGSVVPSLVFRGLGVS